MLLKLIINEKNKIMFPKKEKKLFNKIVNQLNKNAKRNREEKYTIKYSNDLKNFNSNTIT